MILCRKCSYLKGKEAGYMYFQERGANAGSNRWLCYCNLRSPCVTDMLVEGQFRLILIFAECETMSIS